MDSTTTLLLLGLVVAVAFILFNKFQQPAKEEKVPRTYQRKANQKKNEQKNQSKNKGKQTKANDAQNQPTATQKKETQPKQKKKKGNNKAGIGFYHGEEVDNTPENVLEFLKGKEFNERGPEEEETSQTQDREVDAESDEDDDFTKIRKKATAPPKKKVEKKDNEGKKKRKTAFFKDEEAAKAQPPTGTRERRRPRQPREDDATQPAAENMEGAVDADNENKPPRQRNRVPRDVPPRKAKTDSESETQEPEEEAQEGKHERREPREPREPRKPRPPQGPPSFDSSYETATVDELLNNMTNFYSTNPKGNNTSRKERKSTEL